MKVSIYAKKEGFEVNTTNDGRISIKMPEKEIGIVVPDDDVEKEVWEIYKEKIKTTKEIDAEKLLEKEMIMENVIIAPLFRDKKYIKDELVIANEIGEITFVYRVILPEELSPNGELGASSIVLNKKMIKIANIDEEELHEKARKNTARSIKVKGMIEVLAEMLNDDGVFEYQEEDAMFVAMNEIKLFTSGALECPKTMRVIFDEVKKKAYKEGKQITYEDLIVLPSSKHEFIIVPLTNDNMNLDDFVNMVKEVNATEVEEKDRLDDAVYRFRFEGSNKMYVTRYSENGKNIYKIES